MKDYRLKDVFTLEDDALFNEDCKLRLSTILGSVLPWVSRTYEEKHFSNGTYFRMATVFYQFLQSHGKTLTRLNIQIYASAAAILALYAEEESDFNLWLTESYSYMTAHTYTSREIELAVIDLLQKIDYRLYKFETLYDSYVDILFNKLTPSEHEQMTGQLSLVTFCHQHTRFDHELLLGLLSFILFEDDHGILKSCPATSEDTARQCSYFLMDIFKAFPSSHNHFSINHREDMHKFIREDTDKIINFCRGLVLRDTHDAPYVLPQKINLYLRKLRFQARALDLPRHEDHLSLWSRTKHSAKSHPDKSSTWRKILHIDKSNDSTRKAAYISSKKRK